MVTSVAQTPEESTSTNGFYTELKLSVNSKEDLETVIRSHELVPLWNTGKQHKHY